MAQSEVKSGSATYSSHIIGWAENHSAGQVLYLYSSATTAPDAVKRTEKELLDQGKKRGLRAVGLKDTHSYRKIAKNPDVFSSKVPVYLRADLARIIATVAIVEETQKPVIYADMDVTPLKKEELFDEKTKKDIDTYGIVMDHSEIAAFENSFHMMVPQKEVLVSMKKVLIKPTITYVRNHLDNSSRYNKNAINPEFAYYMHKMVLFMYYQMRGWGKVSFWGKPYNMDKHGLTKVHKMITQGEDWGRVLANTYFEANDTNKDFIDEHSAKRIYYPTKKTQSPPRRHYYYDDN